MRQRPVAANIPRFPGSERASVFHGFRSKKLQGHAGFEAPTTVAVLVAKISVLVAVV